MNERCEWNFGETHNDSFFMWSIITEVNQDFHSKKNAIFKQNNLQMTIHLLGSLWLAV